MGLGVEVEGTTGVGVGEEHELNMFANNIMVKEKIIFEKILEGNRLDLFVVVIRLITVGIRLVDLSYIRENNCEPILREMAKLESERNRLHELDVHMELW